MPEDTTNDLITIDGTEYRVSELSERAKQHIASIQFVDAQMTQINNELAVADTARIGYTAALKAEMTIKSAEAK